MFEGIRTFEILYYVWLLGMAAAHLSLTVIVYREAQNLRRSALGISPLLWGGVAFSLPVIGMFVFWLMNYSTLCVEIQRSNIRDESIRNYEKH